VNEIAGPGTHAVSIAPPPDTDRSALSEAWYRALYGSKPKDARPRCAALAPSPRAGAAAPQTARDVSTAQRAHARVAGNAARPAMRSRPAFAVASLQRIRSDRLPPATAAARVWRSALARRTLCRFTLPDGARIDLLLQQRGRRLHAVAIAGMGVGAHAEQRLDAALGRARAALLAHGVRLDSAHSLKGLE
jgi:hypothetical protein